MRERSRKWAAANRPRRREIQQRYDETRGRDKKRERYAEVSADPARDAVRRERSRQYYQANKERLKEAARRRRQQNPTANRKSMHGADWDMLFRALWDAQGGRCYLCQDALNLAADRDIHLDHDHACCGPMRTCEKCRRGLACKRCNFVIAWAGDDPDRLRRIAGNLEAVQLGHVRAPTASPRR